MKNQIKKILPVEWVRRIAEFRYNNFPNGIIQEWEKNGSPIPPHPVVKQKVIRDIQKKYGYQILVETGTYLGYMVSAQKHNFEKIYSIELGDDLYQRAVKKFEKYDHITIVHGDSGDMLPVIMEKIDQPAIFWLDGHYSGGITAQGAQNCPIWKELDAIFSNKMDHIIVIDDARDFIGKNDYPTIMEIETYLQSKNSAYKITIKDDVFRAEL